VAGVRGAKAADGIIAWVGCDTHLHDINIIAALVIMIIIIIVIIISIAVEALEYLPQIYCRCHDQNSDQLAFFSWSSVLNWAGGDDGSGGSDVLVMKRHYAHELPWRWCSVAVSENLCECELRCWQAWKRCYRQCHHLLLSKFSGVFCKVLHKHHTSHITHHMSHGEYRASHVRSPWPLVEAD
jgi:hypothetical protein